MTAMNAEIGRVGNRRLFVAGLFVLLGLAIFSQAWLPGRASAQTNEEVQAALHLIDEYAASNAPNSFAGLYRDEQRLVFVGFTGNADQHLANLQALFPYPDLLRLFPATYSLALLDQTVTTISADLPALREEGIIISSVSTDIPNNRVTITMPSVDPQLSALLAERYGPQIFVTQGGFACTAEALICPDGTLVGRTGPNCEFASCPEGPIEGESFLQDDGATRVLPKTGLSAAGIASLLALIGIGAFLTWHRRAA